MNIRVVGFALFSLFFGGSSLIADCTSQPWTFANAYVTTTCGNVGIGTTSPVNPLDVVGTARFESDIFMGPVNSANAKLWLWPGTSGPWMQGQSQPDGTSIFFRGQGGTFTFSNSNMSLVGWQNPATFTIGTSNWNGVIDAPASMFVNINSNNDYPSGTGFKIGTSRTAWTGGSDLFTILQTGEVGIGTGSPASGVKLDINAASTTSVALNTNGEAVVAGGLYVHATKAAGINANGAGLLSFRAGGVDGRLQIGVNGNVGIGMAPTANLLDVNGNAHFNGTVTGNNIQAQYQDVAEWVSASEPIPPGTVVVVNENAINGVAPSARAYDTAVAGVISAQPGVLLGAAGSSKVKVATTGRVKVRVDASRLPVRPGDLLVSSDQSGMAMRSEPIDVGGVKMHRPGTLIGKALEPLESGEGEILVLLSLQ